MVIAGKDKGKKGAIIESFPLQNRVVVEGVNIAKISEKPRTSGGKGQMIERAMPLHASNVMMVDPKDNVRTRLSIKNIGGKNVRVTKKSGSELK